MKNKKDMENKKFMQALLPICMQMATAEGITDEGESVVRANAIAEDAVLDKPLTEAGIKARVRTMEVLSVHATNDTSTTQIKFDYDKFRDETSIPAICAIIKQMGERAEYLAIPSKPSPEYEKKAEEAYESLSLATFSALNMNKVGMAEYKFIFDSLKSIISALENHVMNQVTGHRHEIMSRLLDTKNPGTDKFDANYAPYAKVIELLEKTREQTGGKLSDYFNISPKE